MNKTQEKRYEELRRDAFVALAKDAESRFALAAIYRDMVAIAGSLQVSRDLSVGRKQIESYIKILDFWGDKRIANDASRPASWVGYGVIARAFSDGVYSRDSDRIKDARDARNLQKMAVSKGWYAVKSELEEREKKYRPIREAAAVSEREQKQMDALMSGLVIDRFVGNCYTFDKLPDTSLYSVEHLDAIVEGYVHLGAELVRLGILQSAGRPRRHLKKAA